MKILFVDRPFSEQAGGDKNRALYTYRLLSKYFQTDLMTVSQEAEKNSDGNFHLKGKNARIYHPDSVMQYHENELEKFRRILQESNYDIIFLKHLCPALLSFEARKVLPKARIIYDVDMYPLRLLLMHWKLEMSLKNRYFFFSYLKMKIFERMLFSQPYLFLFSNSVEKQEIEEKYLRKSNLQRFEVFPNALPITSYKKKIVKDHQKYILFYGALNSMVNINAYQYLVQKLYPKIDHVLKKNNCMIYIVGRKSTPIYFQDTFDQVKFIGPVENIDEYICNSEFVLLPLQSATGTCTRIVESAANRKCVITTPIGSEGIDLMPNSEILVEESLEGLVKAISNCLEDPSLPTTIGNNAYDKCSRLYHPDVVSEKLIQEINQYRAIE